MHTAIIPAAGSGTRLAPLTRTIPKPLVPVLDRPAVARCVDEIAAAGFERVLVVTSGRPWFDEWLLRALDGALVSVEIVHQPVPLGVGDAVARAMTRVGLDEPWVTVVLPDVVAVDAPNPLRPLLEVASAHSAGVVNLIPRPAAEAHQHGVADIGPADPFSPGPVRIRRVIEKPSRWTEGLTIGVVGGRYVLPRSDCERLLTEPRPRVGELGLETVLDRLAGRGNLYGLSTGSALVDIGQPAGYVSAWVRSALQNSAFREVIIAEVGGYL